MTFKILRRAFLSLSRISKGSQICKRPFSTTQPKRMSHQDFQQQGIPGSNLPFGIGCKYKTTIGFAIFWGSALTAPFLIYRRVLWLAQPGDESRSPQQLAKTICWEDVDEEEE